MKTLATLLMLAVTLTACGHRGGNVVPDSPGEIAASYTTDIIKYEKITAQLLAVNQITPDVAQQIHDALKGATASLRLYYKMSQCENVQIAELAASVKGSGQMVSAASLVLCARLKGQPLDEIAQLKLAQAALAALAQQLAK